MINESDDINYYLLERKDWLNKEIGQKLKERRKDLGKSLLDLSIETNTSITYISQIERGNYNISLYKFILICNSLHINTFRFLDEFIIYENKKEDILYEKLQGDKNISRNVLEFIKEC